jgi:hypothetical protein
LIPTFFSGFRRIFTCNASQLDTGDRGDDLVASRIDDGGDAAAAAPNGGSKGNTPAASTSTALCLNNEHDSARLRIDALNFPDPVDVLTFFLATFDPGEGV